MHSSPRTKFGRWLTPIRPHFCRRGRHRAEPQKWVWLEQGRRAGSHRDTRPNPKTYIAGPLHADTGTITAVEGDSHDSDLFCRLAERVRLRYRGFSEVNLICDNAPNHPSNSTDDWFDEHDRIGRIFEPTYHPWVNRIEKLWGQLHKTVTRQHQCQTLEELLKKVRQFIDTAAPFPGSDQDPATAV